MPNESDNQAGVKIEVHLIQNFAPSNLNRDDTGQPKSATFGGFRRARFSSQCSKRSSREWWREANTISVGERTKKLQEMIGKKLAEDAEFCKDKDEALRADGVRVFTDAYYAAADKKKPENTSVLLFVSPQEVDICVQAVKYLWADRTSSDGGPQGDEEQDSDETTKGKKKAKDSKFEGIATTVDKRRKAAEKKGKKAEDTSGADQEHDEADDADGPSDAGADGKKKSVTNMKKRKEIEDAIKAAQVSADIALFGRMLAEQPGRNTDGACQVAHPISTHKVDMEMDFYTAVDDLNPKEETGAGMMGVVGFNSACYYRYALVDRDQLARNIARKTERSNGAWSQDLTDEDYAEADKVIKAFLEAMVYAIPTGKQNSFAAQNLPSFGLFVRRKGGVPISLANAFAIPVRPAQKDDDLVGLSVAALTKHWDSIKAVYGEQGVTQKSLFHLEQEGRLNGLADADKKTVKDAIDAVVNPQ